MHRATTRSMVSSEVTSIIANYSHTQKSHNFTILKIAYPKSLFKPTWDMSVNTKNTTKTENNIEKMRQTGLTTITSKHRYIYAHKSI